MIPVVESFALQVKVPVSVRLTANSTSKENVGDMLYITALGGSGPSLNFQLGTKQNS